jgi:tetratricopeptide (TPR) repeat protein
VKDDFVSETSMDRKYSELQPCSPFKKQKNSMSEAKSTSWWKYGLAAAAAIGVGYVGYQLWNTGEYEEQMEQLRQAKKNKVRKYKKIKELHQENSDVPSDEMIGKVEVLSIDDLFLEGKDRFHAGKYDEAARCYQEVIELDRTNVKAYLNLSKSLYKMGDFHKAVEHSALAVDLDPENEDCQAVHGTALLALGFYLDAKNSLEKALSLMGESGSAKRRQQLRSKVTECERLMNSFMKSMHAEKTAETKVEATVQPETEEEQLLRREWRRRYSESVAEMLEKIPTAEEDTKQSPLTDSVSSIDREVVETVKGKMQSVFAELESRVTKPVEGTMTDSFVLTKSIVFVPDARTVDMMEGLESLSRNLKTPPPSPRSGAFEILMSHEEGAMAHNKLVESIEALQH